VIVVIGIDPGLDGGIAAVPLRGPSDIGSPRASVTPMPVIGKKGKGKRALNLDAIVALVREVDQRAGGGPGAVRIVLETQQAMPGQGVSSMFQIGRGFGALEMLGPAMRHATTYVRPQEWQKEMLAGTPADMDTKGRAELAAQRLWPGVDFRESERCKKAHDGMVDALLIAWWWASRLAPSACATLPAVTRDVVVRHG